MHAISSDNARWRRLVFGSGNCFSEAFTVSFREEISYTLHRWIFHGKLGGTAYRMSWKSSFVEQLTRTTEKQQSIACWTFWIFGICYSFFIFVYMRWLEYLFDMVIMLKMYYLLITYISFYSSKKHWEKCSKESKEGIFWTLNSLIHSIHWPPKHTHIHRWNRIQLQPAVSI